MLSRRSQNDSRVWKVFTPLGALCVGLSLLLGRFSASFGIGAFMEGLFLGLGITASTAGLIHSIKKEGACDGSAR
ncbi:MAG: hypothetical protein MUF59_06125 [Candidatus Krumholzibacteria bacterium]|nr:hypothetical protein [Candidatus Krumholzibacteria bacterium]